MCPCKVRMRPCIHDFHGRQTVDAGVAALVPGFYQAGQHFQLREQYLRPGFPKASELVTVASRRKCACQLEVLTFTEVWPGLREKIGGRDWLQVLPSVSRRTGWPVLDHKA